MISIDILIPTRNRHDCLAQSLPSLRRAAAHGHSQIIICDQSPKPFTAPDIITLHRPDLNGLPAARNVLLEYSQADVVIFLDDDTDITIDFVVTVRRLAHSEPHFTAWGPVIEQRGRWLRRLHRLVHLGVFADARRQTTGPFDHPTTLLFGCCFAVRRIAALAVGFDARRPGYALGEDADFFYRLRYADHRHQGRLVARFCRQLSAIHRRDGHDRADPVARGRAKGAFLWWWARRHGGHHPLTLIHLGIALLAAASGFGAEPANWRGVCQGLGQDVGTGNKDKR
jgi:GT2 family glycosyltransferase